MIRVALRGLDVLESRYLLSFSPVQAGDANLDGYVNEVDILQVLKAGKYFTGEPATWSEGDWNAAPGGDSENPPTGDGVFDAHDVLAMVVNEPYRTGPYADVDAPILHEAQCLDNNGQSGDDQTSLVYDPSSGELSIDSPAGKELTSILIESGDGIFIGDRPRALDGTFDVFTSHALFKAVFGGSFGSISFGNAVSDHRQSRWLEEGP